MPDEKRTVTVSTKLTEAQAAWLDAEVRRLEALHVGLEASRGSVLRGFVVTAMNAKKGKR